MGGKKNDLALKFWFYLAYKKALRCDSVSAFGGIIALNKELDAETAKEISEIFTEVIITPSISNEAKNILSSKKNLRILITGGLADPEKSGISLQITGSPWGLFAKVQNEYGPWSIS